MSFQAWPLAGPVLSAIRAARASPYGEPALGSIPVLICAAMLGLHCGAVGTLPRPPSLFRPDHPIPLALCYFVVSR